MVWVEYPPCSFKEMLTDVPPNLPTMGNAHWLGRSMPGADHAFKSGEQVADLIHSFRNALGITTDDEWPGGPPPPRQGAPLPSGAIDTTPPDGLDRSPLRIGEYHKVLLDHQVCIRSLEMLLINVIYKTSYDEHKKNLLV